MMYGISIFELWNAYYICSNYLPLAISRIDQRINCLLWLSLVFAIIAGYNQQ